MKKVNIENFDQVVFVITKEHIDHQDFEEVQSFLNLLMEDPIKYESKIFLVIHGYDNDSRELYEIQEIRDYFVILDKLFPYWFYFMLKKIEKNHSSLSLIMLLLVPFEINSEKEGVKNVEYDIQKFNDFMNIHFHYLNELTDKLGLSDEVNKRISLDVLNVFK
jgi:hypothetical protein